jgi:hypothetical protein
VQECSFRTAAVPQGARRETTGEGNEDAQHAVWQQIACLGYLHRMFKMARYRMADGSVDFNLQKDSPEKDKESNWLPAFAGRVILILRLYWPEESPPSIVDGTWKPPAEQRVQYRVSRDE